MILWGHSLGSALVIDVASKNNFAGVILEGGFTSIEDMRVYLLNYHKSKKTLLDLLKSVFYGLLEITQKFESKAKISNIKSPTLIIHSEKDEIVPFRMGLNLSKLKPDAKTYFVKEGSHVIFDWQKAGILNFLNRVI